ncbi:hypothetical protein HQ560_07260 [bacterium]|nr:hypothetical protein [bacterium]
MADGNVVYLDIQEFDGGKVTRGGALVVDPTTKPLEFRCTDAVRPSGLQKVLWGARLEGHVATDLIGKPLLRALKQPYSVVVVRREALLDLRHGLSAPVIQLVHDTQVGFDKNDEGIDMQGESDPRVLTNPQGLFEPVTLNPQQLHNGDVKTARPILELVFLKHDLLEPFSRIATALDVLHDQAKSE